MPRLSQSVQALAALGAKVRIQELEAEIAELRRAYPSGRVSSGAVASSVAASRKSEAPVRKRRKMSAKARAAISAAQKARWAKQKAGKK